MQTTLNRADFRRFLAIPTRWMDNDIYGHVNNVVYLRWVQDVATAHWFAAAPPEDQASVIWMVVRHEIDYLRGLGPGESVTGRTWVGEAPRGARFDRHVEFIGADGKPRVRARTTWAIIDKASGRPLRVPPEVAAPFLA